METEAKGDDQSRNVRTSAAYQIATNATSYLHSRTEAILPSNSSNDKVDQSVKNRSINSEMALLMATTDSVTVVVATKEEVKQAVADDLSSISSSPCEWFVCDDEKSATGLFVIQGSETLASWQANLLFEPTQFEKPLYAPMGEMIILQPDVKFSPKHDLFPSSSGLYLLTCKVGDARKAEKKL